MRNKKTYILIVVLTTLAFGLFVSKTTVSMESAPKNDYSIIGDFDFSSVFKSDNFESCVISDEIEYFAYSQGNTKKNNKFGLYAYAESKDFIRMTASLVNSNNGNWGYILLPYNVHDTNRSKWQGVFDLLLEKRLIPIIQLNDVDIDDYKNQTQEAAEFLDSFIWPVKQRYISVYNEPNDADFWYGRVAPEEYAEILDYTIDTFKDQNENFFMLNGALNVSAATTSTSLDAFVYMYRMNESVPGVFAKLDGWASHSYPQPNFSGSPYSLGRWSIKAYEEELNYLNNTFGVDTASLPVFITETGWAHAEGESWNSSYLPVETISEYFRIAYEEVWLNDDKVQAVTPFTIWYEPPFDNFAWINKDKVPYKHYEDLKKIKKVSGHPQKLEKRTISINNCNN